MMINPYALATAHQRVELAEQTTGRPNMTHVLQGSTALYDFFIADKLIRKRQEYVLDLNQTERILVQLKGANHELYE